MMAAADSQQTWVPYVPTRDCSMDFCSVYCPQWCYIIFPPPPPAEFSNDDSGVTFSPLVIAIIGILSSAFLLICYYTIVSKYCGNLNSLPRWHHSPAGNGHQELVGSQSRRRESWHESPSNGVDEALISKIAVHKYRRGDGVVSGSDCSVCLSEFREDDRLRLLPKCSHAFHLPCIDTWLRSHSSCPLCRASIVPVNPAPSSTVAAAPEPASASQIEEEMVVVVEDRVASVEEASGHGSSGDAAKGASQIYCDSGGVEASHHRHSVVELRDDDVIDDYDAVDIVLENGRTSIAGVLRINMEEQASEKENGFWVGNTSHRAAGDHSKGSSRSRGLNLHGVMSAVPMKRSASNGRFCLSKLGKGRNVHEAIYRSICSIEKEL